MSKLNFSIALKMTTAQFKKGADAVKKSLKDIQYQVLGMVSALGVGALGLKGMISQFVDVARETNRARVALKNISGDAAGYANNINFLIRTSRKWGQELNGMTSEFSKFSAAASSAGIPIKQQQEIFESFTRTITAFGMGGDEAKLSYLALSQMMSKGKVSSEELRRQLGEKMPVAMEAMARAAGVTIQELDGLLSQGKLISKDIMLPFVKEMEKMLPNVNVDNIETSINRLKNTFTKLTEDLKVGEFYKKLVDGANKALAGVQQSFARIALVITNAFIGAKVTASMVKFRAKTAETNAAVLAEKQRTELQKQVAAEKRVAAEMRLNELSAIYEKNKDEQTFQNKIKLYAQEQAVTKARRREKAADLAYEKAMAATTTSIWSTTWRSVRASAIAAFGTIKALMVSILPMAIIGAITNLIMKIREAEKEAKRISRIFSEKSNELNNISSNDEIEKIKSLQKIITQRIGTSEEVNSAHRELLRMLDIEIGAQDDINKKIAERIKLLEATARVDKAIQVKLEAEEEIKRLTAEVKEHQAKIKAKGGFSFSFGKPKAQNDYNELKEWIKVRDEADKTIQDGIGKTLTVTRDPVTASPTGDTSKSDKTDLQKAEERYASELQKLTNQKEAEVIKTEEYNKAIDSLNKATYEEIGGLLGVAAERNKIFQKAKEGVENPLSASSELAKVMEDYQSSLKALDKKKRLELVTNEQYNTAVIDLISATTDKVASFEKVGKAEEDYINTLRGVSKGLMSIPEIGERDTTFDYKKSKSDILSEDLALQKQYAEDMEDAYRRAGQLTKEVLAEIAKEQEKVQSLSEALKLAQLKEDMESINTDLFSKSISGVTGFADGLDRVTNSWKRLANEDLSGFEKMVAIINALGDTLKSLISTWEVYDTIRELISQKEQVRQSIENINTAQSIANSSAEMAMSAATVAAKGPEVAANTADAASKAASSVAGVPLVGPILAVAAVGSVLAALANLPKFAHGGIVGGSSRIGDQNLIRANSGEMILTSAQQSGLWNAIRSGNYGKAGNGGNVEFKIRGRDLVGVINQETKIKARA